MGWGTPSGVISQEDAAVRVAIKRSIRAKDYNVGLNYIKTWTEKWSVKGLNCEYVKNKFIEWSCNDELQND